MKILSLKEREDWFCKNIYIRDNCVGSPYDLEVELKGTDEEKHEQLDQWSIPREVDESWNVYN